MDFDFDPFDGDHDWLDAVIIGSCMDSIAAEELDNEEQRRRKLEEELFSDQNEVDWSAPESEDDNL
jgi:hypothetical protein